MMDVYQFLPQLVAVLTVILMILGVLVMPFILALAKKAIPDKKLYNDALAGWRSWRESQAYLSYIVKYHRTFNHF